MVNLTDWFFMRINHFHLMGNATGHPRFSDGTFITTSGIETIQRQGNVLVARTMSGTIYYLELAELDAKNDFADDTKAALKSFSFEDSIIGEAEVLAEKKKAEMLDSAGRVLENNELLILMAGTSVVRAFFKLHNKIEVCQVSVHTGMFQDSVLICLSGKVDFRYFPNASGCSVYHWSDGLENVKIQNVGTAHVVFEGRGRTLMVRQAEIKSLNKNIFASEGLFSPDFVNGKSILSK